LCLFRFHYNSLHFISFYRIIVYQKMPTKTKTKTNTRRRAKSNRRQHTLKGGRTLISHPKISYEKGGNHHPHALTCTKCNKDTFIVKTLTLGTKIKSFFGVNILNNRFKVFTCASCGFVQLYSNNVTCDGKECDPLFRK